MHKKLTLLQIVQELLLKFNQDSTQKNRRQNKHQLSNSKISPTPNLKSLARNLPLSLNQTHLHAKITSSSDPRPPLHV